MTDFFDFPGRPDHPDFWTLSEVLLAHDAAAGEGGQDLPTILNEIPIDVQVVTYVGAQRLGKLLGRDPADPRIASFVAVWIDGVAAGAQFAKRRQESKGHDDPS